MPSKYHSRLIDFRQRNGWEVFDAYYKKKYYSLLRKQKMKPHHSHHIDLHIVDDVSAFYAQDQENEKRM